MPVTLKIKVVPSSARDSIAGWLGDALKIKVMAPAEKGKANKATIKLLATRLNLDRQAIAITSGHTSPNKTITIEGVTEVEVKAALKE